MYLSTKHNSGTESFIYVLDPTIWYGIDTVPIANTLSKYREPTIRDK